MKMQLSILFIVVLLSSITHAQAPIEGGFGLKLGDVLNTDSSEVEAVESFDTTVYRVAPPKPLSGFHDYMVYITPLTHKIYQIKAFHHFKTADAAKNEFFVLGNILKNKYWKTGRTRKGRTSPPLQPKDKSARFRVGRNLIEISYYTPKDVANVDRVTDEFVYSRVVITYRSKDIELRDEEFRVMYKNRQEQHGKNRAKQAESVL